MLNNSANKTNSVKIASAKRGPKKRGRPSGGQMKRQTSEIIALLQSGMKCAAVADQLNINRPIVYSINKRYRDTIEPNKLLLSQANIVNYEKELVSNIKKIVLVISNNLLNNTYLHNVPLGQQAQAMSTLIDKLRLIEGKSTSNTDVHVLLDTNPDLKLTLISFAEEFKKRMLIGDDNTKGVSRSSEAILVN